jgi:hypothetical protein
MSRGNDDLCIDGTTTVAAAITAVAERAVSTAVAVVVLTYVHGI